MAARVEQEIIPADVDPAVIDVRVTACRSGERRNRRDGWLRRAVGTPEPERALVRCVIQGWARPTCAGHTVVARVGDGESLRAVVAEHDPDLTIVDVRMPPTFEDEGMRAAADIRQAHPRTAVLVLSQHTESRHAVALVSSGGGFGYLLKDRILDVDEFLDVADRVAAGGSALDPEVVKHLLAPPKDSGVLAALTPREREVLGLMAEGRTNAGIAKHLWLTEKTVESHVSSILGKLGLSQAADGHRRVLAVLAYLRASVSAA